MAGGWGVTLLRPLLGPPRCDPSVRWVIAALLTVVKHACICTSVSVMTFHMDVFGKKDLTSKL